MKVSIIKKGNTKPATPITVTNAIGGTLTEEEIENEAWEAAVEDGVVKDDERNKYRFVIDA